MSELNLNPIRLGIVLLFKNIWRNVFLVNKVGWDRLGGVWQRKDKEKEKATYSK